MYKWARVTDNGQQQKTAQWLFAREAQSASTYYLAFDTTRPELQGYGHSIASILWGGKFDYATFFDALAEAKLAIQLLPLNPAAGYVAENRARAQQNYDAMLREAGMPKLFKDYLAMYQATFDKPAAIKNATALAEADIDGANSRSYMLGWIFTR